MNKKQKNIIMYCEELNTVTIKRSLAVDSETGIYYYPVEWDINDMLDAKRARSQYKGKADLAALFRWIEIGDFD